MLHSILQFNVAAARLKSDAERSLLVRRQWIQHATLIGSLTEWPRYESAVAGAMERRKQGRSTV